MKHLLTFLILAVLVSCGTATRTQTVNLDGSVTTDIAVKTAGGRGVVMDKSQGFVFIYDYRQSFKDFMDFTGTATTGYFAYKTVAAQQVTKQVQSNNGAKVAIGQQSVVKNGQNVTGSVSKAAISNNTALESPVSSSVIRPITNR